MTDAAMKPKQALVTPPRRLSTAVLTMRVLELRAARRRRALHLARSRRS